MIVPGLLLTTTMQSPFRGHVWSPDVEENAILTLNVTTDCGDEKSFDQRCCGIKKGKKKKDGRAC